jgi:uncharacterized protein (TIGR03382 family)
MKAILLGFCLALPLVTPSTASADTCNRWLNDLQPCDGLVASPTCLDSTQASWSWGQKLNYRRWIYASTPEKACEKLVTKAWPGFEDLVKVYPVPATGEYICRYDYDNDNDIDADDEAATGSPIHLAVVEKDECCSLKPNGPYKNLPSPPPGASYRQFSYEQKVALKNWRIMQSGALYSDAPVDSTEAYDALDWTRYVDLDDDLEEPSTTPLSTSRKNDLHVDHIIPRVDSNGCPCGSNKIANAALVSADINMRMSNSCENPDRKKMLRDYTLAPAPLTLDPTREVGTSGGAISEDSVDAEATSETETGGCSASTGGSLMLGLSLLALLLRRRPGATA